MAKANYAILFLYFAAALVVISGAERSAAQSMRENENLGEFFKQQRTSRRGFSGGLNDTFDLFAYTDVNNDKTITATEYIKMMENQFHIFREENKVLTWSRLMEIMNDVRHRTGQPIDPNKRIEFRLMFNMIDRDRDMAVSFGEFQKSAILMYETVDLNGDEILTKAEFEVAPERVILPVKEKVDLE